MTAPAPQAPSAASAAVLQSILGVLASIVNAMIESLEENHRFNPAAWLLRRQLRRTRDELARMADTSAAAAPAEPAMPAVPPVPSIAPAPPQATPSRAPATATTTATGPTRPMPALSEGTIIPFRPPAPVRKKARHPDPQSHALIIPV